MPFRHEVTVRFHDVDRAGIAYFGRVFEYCHEAFEELLAAGGAALGSVFDVESWGGPLVHASADYERPMRLGERLGIEVEVERLGPRSVGFAFVVRGPEGDVRARVRHVHAFVDLETFTPIPVPDRFRRALEAAGLVEA